MQYQKRGYTKTYDENGNLLEKVPAQPEPEFPVEEDEDELADYRDE